MSSTAAAYNALSHTDQARCYGPSSFSRSLSSHTSARRQKACIQQVSPAFASIYITLIVYSDDPLGLRIRHVRNHRRAVNYALTLIKIGRLCHSAAREHPSDRSTSIDGYSMCFMRCSEVLLRPQSPALESLDFVIGDTQHRCGCRSRSGLCSEGQSFSLSLFAS